MRVAVTGGTGFVGSHTVAALLRAGHEVRMLVRSPEKVAGALAPLGVSVPAEAVVKGDVTDAASVEAALDGVDALVHAAAVFSLDKKRAAEIAATNVASTKVVLEAAVARRLDPIVHVSSFVALLPGPGAPVGNEAPVGSPEGVYCISKADSERVARALQDQGHPVVVVWPGAIMGPHDPYLGESNQVALTWLRDDGLQWSTGAYPLNDVRDVAAVIAAAMQPGRGPRRYFAVDGSLTHGQLSGLISEVAGRPVKVSVYPSWLVTRTARWFGFPPNEEGPYINGCAFQPDAAATAAELGVTFRPKVETLRDTARWLVEAGHLPAGRVAAR